SASISLSIFSVHADHPALHSFPTRRSSDLAGHVPAPAPGVIARPAVRPDTNGRPRPPVPRPGRDGHRSPSDPASPARPETREHRSEEHTSELQSRENLVCRLLLEKKKKKHT